jgi:glucan phosphoethanolaminetransferase (alkaline phosphatase superfamily)
MNEWKAQLKMNSDPSANGVWRLVPVCGVFTAGYTLFMFILVLVGFRLTGGRWPAPVKFWVCAASFVAVSIYWLVSGRRHAVQYREAAKGNLSSADLCLLIGFLGFWLAFFIWIVFGPPGPQLFRILRA